MTNYNEQEAFWHSDFNKEYINRNKSIELKKSKELMFKKMLRSIDVLDSVIELGANIGLNIEALHTIHDHLELCAIEINKAACDILSSKNICTVINQSIAETTIDRTFDLTFTSGVLIHINPDQLDNIYGKLYQYSNKYILINEYYNPTPETIQYRGEDNKLFKRDFAKEIMDTYPKLVLVDYGFFYEHDKTIRPPSSSNWFLLKK